MFPLGEATLVAGREETVHLIFTMHLQAYVWDKA